MKRLMIFSCLLLCSSLIAEAGGDKNLIARDGVLDLRDINWREHPVVTLNGDWEFYWNRFVTPEGLTRDPGLGYDCLGRVPSYWNDYSSGDGSFPNHGFASYRLVVLLPEETSQTLALDVPVFDDAFRLFVNGVDQGGNGTVGTSRATSKPGYDPYILRLEPVADTIEFILHVSNFHHRRGGFWKSMTLGKHEKIMQSDSLNKLFRHVSLGMLVSFSLFFLFFYLLFRKEKILLFFALMLAGIFIRMLATDTYSIQTGVDIAWPWLIRTEYSGTFLAFTFGSWYFYALYPGRLLKQVTWLNTLLSGICLMLIMALPVRYFAYTMLYFQPAALLFFLCYLYRSGAGFIRKEMRDILLFSALLIFLLALVHDILVANSQAAIWSGYVSNFAMLALVFIQALILIEQWLNTYRENEKLVREIIHINRNLENIVDERTDELNTRNREINTQNEQIARQNILLQESLDVKNRVFSIISHDLKSPVASLVQFFDLLKEDLNEADKQSIITSSRNLLKSVTILIDNLLYWGQGQLNRIQYKPEACEMTPLINDVLGLFEETARQKSILVHHQPAEELKGFVDRELIRMVLRNLLSNAIKFSHPGGAIYINVDPDPGDEKQFMISIEDSGVGMSRQKQEDLLIRSAIDSSYGTANEKGIGLGLTLARDLVLINKGSFSLESEEGKGTTIRVGLPRA